MPSRRDAPDAGHVLDVVAARLRASGQHMTRPRRAVAEVLAAAGGHLGAEGVVQAVAEQAPDVHRASVYRALEALAAAGVVQHVHLGHGGTAYHLVDLGADGGGRHLHLQCDGCGTVVDAPAAVLAGASRRLRRDHGFVLDATHVALSGRCAACAGGSTRPG
ncbi:Fur family transcriptional regulator [Aquipuribacter nitratireducens]|uniref:Fur family transcriptional regulator n=1 Tax=Aquipuribacter nitratireducens TaxID=650104 RepID=A0ABW0GSB5_9MICO